MLSPSACAFSRSISSQIDGLLAVKVENTRARRGSWLAAATSPCITLAISAGSRPSRFSSWYSKPPLVDSPMIGGRLKGNMLAERTCCTAPNTRPIIACAPSAAAVRSANGLSRITTKAAFGSSPPSSSEKPTIDSTPSICGIGRSRSSTCCATARVRDTDAPSGNCTATKNAPWSSSGRNPVGVRSASPQMPAPAMAIASTDSTDTRSNRSTTAA